MERVTFKYLFYGDFHPQFCFNFICFYCYMNGIGINISSHLNEPKAQNEWVKRMLTSEKLLTDLSD